MTLKLRTAREETTSSKSRTAAYIEELVRELEMLAAKEKIEPLRDLLRRAKEEARRVALAG